jgi:steroid 5-alpha reductase family enzyme
MPNPRRLHAPSTAFMDMTMTNIVLTIAMFAGFALLWGAWKLRQREGMVQKVWLMVVAALVIFANIAIWTVPDERGNSLAKAKSD